MEDPYVAGDQTQQIRRKYPTDNNVIELYDLF